MRTAIGSETTIRTSVYSTLSDVTESAAPFSGPVLDNVGVRAFKWPRSSSCHTNDATGYWN